MRSFVLSAFGLFLTTFLVAEESSRLPEDAQRLQVAYERAVDISIKSLRDKYISELKKLGVVAARDGRLKDAMEIQAEIDRQTAEASNDELKEIKAGILGNWEYKYGSLIGEWVFRGDHTIINHDGRQGSWRIADNELIVEVSHRFLTKYTFPLDGAMAGKVTSTMLIEGGKQRKPATIQKKKP